MLTEDSSAGQPDLDEVLRQVLLRGGLDLSVYRRRTVERRVASRMRQSGSQSCLEYAERLARDSEEVQALIGHVTIKVSRFFRNVEVFRRLREQVLPDLLRRSDVEGGLRIWSAGCGNGEEAYSLAVLLEEMFGQGGPMAGSTVYGTDVDLEALAAARVGVYPPGSVEETSPEYISKYFETLPGRFGSQFRLGIGLRRWVKLHHHNLLSGTPVGGSPFHLILCRNVVIYLQHTAQQRVFRLLSDSLLPGGYLCLGEAEELPGFLRNEFETIDRRARLYRERAKCRRPGPTTVL